MEFYKVLNREMKDLNRRYAKGKNVDLGGICFTTKEHLGKWITSIPFSHYVCKVEVPDDVKIVSIDGGKNCKAHIIFLGPPQHIWSDKELCSIAVFYRPDNMRRVLPNICLELVKRDGLLLRYVSRYSQTEEMCLAAVKQNGLYLQYVNKQTEEI